MHTTRYVILIIHSMLSGGANSKQKISGYLNFGHDGKPFPIYIINKNSSEKNISRLLIYLPLTRLLLFSIGFIAKSSKYYFCLPYPNVICPYHCQCPKVLVE